MGKRGIVVVLILVLVLLSTAPALALDPFATGYTDRLVRVSTTFEDQDGHTVESGAMRGNSQYYAVVKASWYAMSFEVAMGNFSQAVRVSAGGGQEWALRDPNGNVVSDQEQRLSTLGVGHFGPGTVYALAHDWDSMSARVKLTGGSGRYMLGAESFAKTLRQGVGVSLTSNGAILMFDNYEFIEIVGDWAYFNMAGGEWWPTKEKVRFTNYPGNVGYMESWLAQDDGGFVKIESDRPIDQNYYEAGYPVTFETWRQLQGSQPAKYLSRNCLTSGRGCGEVFAYTVWPQGLTGDQVIDWTQLRQATLEELSKLPW